MCCQNVTILEFSPHTWHFSNGVARIFVPPGTFSVVSRSRPDSMGGGEVVAEIFRDLHKRTTFAGENFFRSLQVKITQIPSSPGDFCYISGPPADHPPFLDTHGNSGRLGKSAYTFKERNNINSLEKKSFTKSLGGPWPPWPPPGYATTF